MKLLGVGKHRFATISKAVNEGQDRCPLDQRFLPKEKPPQSVKRQAVYEYLHSLYEQAAERLPDGNASHSNKRPRQGGTSTMTQKCVGMRSDTYPREPLWSTFAFAGWSSLISRSPDNYLLLPQPQQIVGWTCKCVRDVLQFCLNEIGPNLNRFPGANAKVWMEDFRHRLRIRQQGHHARCSVCIRHRLIIRRLGRGPARLAQLEQYKAHLGRQYRDRQVYWSHRARSRSEATSGAPVTHVSMICATAWTKPNMHTPKGRPSMLRSSLRG